MRLEINQTAKGTTAKIAPVTLTPAGMEILRSRNDLWTFNGQGFLARVQRTPCSSCQIATVQFQQTGCKTTGRQSSNDK